jgi:molecular chaperone GrpE (heat shock protein)
MIQYKMSENNIEELQNKIAELEKKIEELTGQNDKLKYIYADSINEYNRLNKKYLICQEESILKFAKSIVSSLEAVDIAIKNVSTTDVNLKPYLDGLLNIRKSFVERLAEFNVFPMNMKIGDTFNPEKQEAIGTKEGEEGKILEVLRVGYHMVKKVGNDSTELLLSPGLVIVGSQKV